MRDAFLFAYSLKRSDLQEFRASYTYTDRAKRRESERLKRFLVADLLKRNKLNLDISWLKDDSLDDIDSLPPPDEIATEIVENLQATLEQFAAVAEALAQPN